MKLNDDIIIKDINDNILCCGVIIATKDVRFDKHNNVIKDNFLLVSLDNKYFFNVFSPNLKFEENINHIKKDYILTDAQSSSYLRNSGDVFDKDVYIEFTINELDEEVKELVFALNNIEGLKTQGSCSGHNRKPLWVSISFFTISSLLFLTRLIFEKFNDEFYISTMPNISQSSSNSVTLSLRTYKIGTEAYKSAKKLSKYLNILWSDYGN